LPYLFDRGVLVDRGARGTLLLPNFLPYIENIKTQNVKLEAHFGVFRTQSIRTIFVSQLIMKDAVCYIFMKVSGEKLDSPIPRLRGRDGDSKQKISSTFGYFSGQNFRVVRYICLPISGKGWGLKP